MNHTYINTRVSCVVNETTKLRLAQLADYRNDCSSEIIRRATDWYIRQVDPSGQLLGVARKAVVCDSLSDQSSAEKQNLLTEVGQNLRLVVRYLAVGEPSSALSAKKLQPNASERSKLRSDL